MPTKRTALGRHVTQSLLGFETSFGVKPVGGFVAVPFYTNALQETRTPGVDPVLGLAAHNNRDTSQLVEGLPSLAGDLSVPFCLNAMGDYLRLLLGAPTSSGAGPYTHVFQSGQDVLPSAHLQNVRRKASASSYYQGFGGIAANTFRVTGAKAEGVQSGMFGLMARAEYDEDETAPWDADPTVRDYLPVRAALTKLSVNGVDGTVFQNQFTFSNNMALRNDADGTEYATGVDVGESGASGSVSARYDDETILALARTGTEVPLALTWTLKDGVSAGQDASLKIAFPHVKIGKRGRPVEGPGGIDLAFEWTAKQSADAAMMTVTLINDVEGAEYGAS